MKNKAFFPILSFLFLITILQACKKDENKTEDPPKAIDFELITTVKLTFTEQGNSAYKSSFYFKDPDGVGGQPPIQLDTIKLTANTLYNCIIEFFDESNPDKVVDVTKEIKQTDSEHIICFTPKNGADLTVKRTDSDGKYEVGLTSTWTIGKASSGSVLVVLKHQVGVKNGQCEPGETDVEVDFPMILY